MIMVAWLGLGLGVWLIDSAVRGRKPIDTLKQVIVSGQPPVTGVSYHATVAASGSAAPSGGGGPTGTSVNPGSATVGGSVNPMGTHYQEGDKVPGTQEQWIDQAIAVLEANGTPANQIDRGAIETIIAGESGGDPTVVNHYDINAKNGHPSKGIMQDIQSTFDGHALPGYNDIFNPVDNIIASVRYSIAQYGSMQNVPGVHSEANGGGYQPY